jgi:hypothetical protein
MTYSGPSLEELVVHVIRAGRGAAYFSVQSSYRATTPNLASKSRFWRVLGESGPKRIETAAQRADRSAMATRCYRLTAF